MAKGRRASSDRTDGTTESSTAATEAGKKRDRERSKIYYANNNIVPVLRNAVKKSVFKWPKDSAHKMLELKQVSDGSPEQDEEEEGLSDWELPGREDLARWKTNREKWEAECRTRGDWFEGEADSQVGSHPHTPVENVPSGSGSEIGVAQETGNKCVGPRLNHAGSASQPPPSFNPTSYSKFQQSQSRAKRTAAQLLRHALEGGGTINQIFCFITVHVDLLFNTLRLSIRPRRRRARGNGNPRLNTWTRADEDETSRLNRLRNEGVIVCGTQVMLAVEIEGFAAGLLVLDELVGNAVSLGVGLGS
ncbi:hypothetical protein C8F04DRAFT_1184250 [Mycena alexandri]|uniref:Uncharacterized protein n=1 Tax=Mycena alexandri TaxID=1745969 RepID=A0AAD6SWW1_9AGAR|nr:hypothetical protein C8F04DRAFT_1184250 [Mycena alexandri]